MLLLIDFLFYLRFRYLLVSDDNLRYIYNLCIYNKSILVEVCILYNYFLSFYL